MSKKSKIIINIFITICMKKKVNLFKTLSVLFSIFIICNFNAYSVLAEDEEIKNDDNEIALIDETYDFKGTGLKRYSATGSTTTWSRAVSTAISLYVKNGTVPQITKYDGTYNGTAYHVLEADTSDGNTLIKVDYAGNTPVYLNNIYDSDLTANDEYYWAGAINAGFFGASASSSSYGYPTGAVRTGGIWQTYSSKFTNYEAWECTPSYGDGFTSYYFNRSGNDAKLLYNGWRNGVFYKYYNDPSPNTWDYSPVYSYSEGVSGAYTLMVDGDTSVHWGKNDYSGTNYWSYTGTAITLFGQKANGNYVLLTTSAGSLTADQCISLMSSLGCVNGIRFDGGGSSQMAYDNGLYIKSISAPSEVELDSIDDLSQISVTVKDGNSKEHTVPLTAVSDDISKTQNGDNSYTVIANTVVGNITVKVNIKEQKIYHVVFDWNYANSGNVWGLDGTDLVLPENSFIKDGYTFTSWNTSIDGTGKEYHPNDLLTEEDFGDNNTLLLYAQWQKDTTIFKITFDWNYGNSGFMSDILVSEGDSLPINTYTKENCTFKGWNTSIDSDGIHFDDQEIISGLENDIVLYAEWEENAKVNIRFDWNYANGGTVDNVSYYLDNPVTLPENGFVKDNSTFIGWNTNIDGSGDTYQAGDYLKTEEASDITLYAMWQKDEGFYSYTIIYDWNYGNSGEMSAYFGSNDVIYTVPECGFARNNMEFVSWNTNIDGTGETFNVGDQLLNLANKDNEQIILYAMWQENGTTNIVYDWNYGNNGSMPITINHKGETLELAKNSFEKDGYQFVGWNTEMDGSGDSYNDGDLVNLYDENKETIVLYAQWRINAFAKDEIQEKTITSEETAIADESVVVEEIPEEKTGEGTPSEDTTVVKEASEEMIEKSILETETAEEHTDFAEN